jgi:hypothetical protein
MSDIDSAKKTVELFSIVEGGPLYRLLVRAGLVRPPLEGISRRIFVILLLAWAPLFVLTVQDGSFWGGVKIPFSRDFEVNVRLLLSLPLLIIAELPIHHRMRIMVSTFLEREIITPATAARYQRALESAMRVTRSTLFELGLLGFVFIAGGIIWRTTMAIESDTWFATVGPNGTTQTTAGVWYQFVSVPIYQFILLRWYFRLFAWVRFLYQVSRLDLNLIATHPDHCCGLKFLENIVYALTPFLVAHSCFVSGFIANHLLYEGARLEDFYFEIGTLAVFFAVVGLGPLCLLSLKLRRAKLKGLRKYGLLASNYVRDFDQKWIGVRPKTDEQLLGTSDIQSLADLANSFAIITSIVPFPFGRKSLTAMAVMIAVPLLPLGLVMVSPWELLKRVAQILI